MNDKQKIIEYWLFSSQDALETADSLFQSQKYNYCLFFCHLALEKYLKAIVVQATDAAAPYTHKLTQLAKLTKLSFTDTQLDQLRTITDFNLEARYEEYKLDFYHKATKEYCLQWYQITQELLKWLKTQLILKS